MSYGMFGESPGRPCWCACSRIKLAATMRIAYLSAKDAKDAKRAKSEGIDVLLALLSFASFASFAEKAFLSETCVIFGEMLVLIDGVGKCGQSSPKGCRFGIAVGKAESRSCNTDNRHQHRAYSTRAFCNWIQPRTCSARIGNGTEPSSRTLSWKARRSKSGPRAASASRRSSTMRILPIM